jgi:hypothetical protein
MKAAKGSKHRGKGVSRQMGVVRGKKISMAAQDSANGWNSQGGTKMRGTAKSMQLHDASSGMKRDAIQTLTRKGR